VDSISKLTEYFREFPGIGPRQAKRFVYFLLTRNHRFIEELTRALLELQKQIAQCEDCKRYFPLGKIERTLCTICSDKNRDASVLMVVEKDVDLETVEKSKVYNGLYFILGGSLPILEKDPQNKIRSNELLTLTSRKIETKIPKLKEIILAISATTEGENTLDYLNALLGPMALMNEVKISMLGRGLATGTELEYSDTDTIKNALKNRQ
jgi:recombination protein RecR